MQNGVYICMYFRKKNMVRQFYVEQTVFEAEIVCQSFEKYHRHIRLCKEEVFRDDRGSERTY